MKLTLNVSTAIWTHEDVAFGANDPERTTSEVIEFDSVGEVVMYLRERNLVEPSSEPVTGNEQRVWWSETSQMMSPGEEDEDRSEVTASRGEGFPDEAWMQVVTDVTQAKRRYLGDHLYVYGTGREDLPIAVGADIANVINGSFAVFADEYAAAFFVTHFSQDRGFTVSILPSAAELGVELIEADVRGCSCGQADFGAPGHDGDANGHG